MRQPRLGFLCVTTVVASFAGAICAQPAEPAMPPAHVAVMNLRLVYQNMQDSIDLQKAVVEMQDQLTKMAASHQTELNADNKKIADAKKASDSEHDAMVAEIDTKILQFQHDEQALKLKMARVQARQLTRAFDRIKAVVTDLATRKGYDAVLVNNGSEVPPIAGDIGNPDTLANLIFNRSALYTSDEADISADVIVLLNKGYIPPAGMTPLPALPTTPMQLGSKTFQLEVAATDTTREHGLMERDTIVPDHGMIFVFPKATEQTFWMRHTRFPLDVIYVDDHGKVVSIKKMKPYDEAVVPSDGDAKYAIELPGGLAASTGLKPGDQLHIPPAVDAALKK